MSLHCGFFGHVHASGQKSLNGSALSCPCLLAQGTVFGAQVVFYDAGGRQLQLFDFASDTGARDFTCCAMNPNNDTAVVGAFDRLYIFSLNNSTGVWQHMAVKQVGDGMEACAMHGTPSTVLVRELACRQAWRVGKHCGMRSLRNAVMMLHDRLATSSQQQVLLGNLTAAGLQWAPCQAHSLCMMRACGGPGDAVETTNCSVWMFCASGCVGPAWRPQGKQQ